MTRWKPRKPRLNVMLLLLGTLLEGLALMIILVPILLEVTRSLGIDPVHFGILTCVNLAIGQQTPPVATVLMTVCGITRTPIKETFPYMVWYLAAMFVVLAVVTYLPLMV